MRVTLLVDRARVGGVDPAGSTVDVSAREARRMIEAGQAQPARGAVPERAVPVFSSEKATRKGKGVRA